MSELHMVDPEGWEYDLQSVYSAYMGYFQLHGIRWDDRPWGHFFETFEQFLAFSWPVIAATDTRTGRAHIVTVTSSIIAFAKMIKTRYDETLPQVDNLLLIKPVEKDHQELWHVHDGPTYKKVYATLPAVALAALKGRIRDGDPSAIRQLWAARDKTFLALDFEFLERHPERPCVEWGYAAIRCSHLEAAGAWPPVPDTNYRKGHFVVSEYTDTFNKASTNVSWLYAFGESQVIPRTRAPRIIESVLSGLLSPDSDTVANNLVLVGHGIQVIIQHLEDIGIELPSNVLAIDVAYLERALFTSGERGSMRDRKTGKARLPESLLTLNSILYALGIEPPCVLHNAGNDAFMALVAFQRMADPSNTVTVTGKGAGVGVGIGRGKKEEASGYGSVKRAANAAARIFRPLGGVHPDPGVQRTTNGNGKENGHGHGHGHEHRNGDPNINGHANGQGQHAHNHTSPRERRDRDRETSKADEMGMAMRRASMFSVLTSPSLVPADKTKIKKGAMNGGGVGNRGSVDLRSAASTISPDRRRHSTVTVVEKRR